MIKLTQDGFVKCVKVGGWILDWGGGSLVKGERKCAIFGWTSIWRGF